jgi:localization factor PodJL
VRWFRRAADDGVVDSQFNLGLLYESGSGVDRNLPEAYKWFTIAADGGDAQAQASAGQLRARLTAAQLATAERAAVTFHATASGRSDLAPITPRAVASAQRAAAAARLSDFAR